MWKWIKGWFGKRTPLKQDGYAYDLYTLEERRIYRYYDGEKLVSADPMALHKRVMDVGPELSVDMKVANSPMKGAKEAHEKMLSKIRVIFSVKRFEEGGLTELETIDLLDHFLNYEDIQKKITQPYPTSPTDPSPSSASSSVESPPTASATASGSTKEESSTSESPSSPTEPVSPSVP